MKKTIGVIGLGRFGIELVQYLSELHVELIAIDKDIEAVKQAGVFVDNVAACDITNEIQLKETGIAEADHVIIAIGQDKMENLSTAILTILRLKQLGIKEITARADKDDYIEILKKVGADHVVSPLMIAAERTASKIGAGNVVDYFNIKNDFDVYEIEVSEQFEATHITNLVIRKKFLANILLIQRNGEVLIPTSEETIYPNDHIFIFGRQKDIPKVIAYFSKK
mgnify:FL=1